MMLTDLDIAERAASMATFALWRDGRFQPYPPSYPFMRAWAMLELAQVLSR